MLFGGPGESMLGFNFKIRQEPNTSLNWGRICIQNGIYRYIWTFLNKLVSYNLFSFFVEKDDSAFIMSPDISTLYYFYSFKRNSYYILPNTL